MPYLIDSDIVIDRLSEDAQIVQFLSGIAPLGLAIAVVTYMEVYQGIFRVLDPDRLAADLDAFVADAPIPPLTPAAARRCAELRQVLDRRDRRVRTRSLDLVTAAIALEFDHALVTRNHADYADVPGLAIVTP